MILNAKSFDFRIMLSHEIISKSKDTEKCMTKLLGFNREIIQKSVFSKLYKIVRIKEKRETLSELENLIFLSKSN